MRRTAKQNKRGLRRPLAVAGLSLFVVMTVLTLCASARVALVTAYVCGAAFLLGLFLLHGRHSLWLCTVSGASLVGCLLFLLSALFVTAPALESTGENVSVSAVVTDVPAPSENGKRCYVTARVAANGKTLPGKVRLSLPAGETNLCDFAAALSPGDTVAFTGTLYVLGAGNDAVRRSFQSRRMFLGAYPTAAATRTPAKHSSLWARFLALRRSAVSTLRSRFPGEVSGVLISLLFGDKSYLSDDTYRAFRDAGVAHLMAVSGMHLSVWVLVLFGVLRRRGCNLRLSAVICMGVTVLVMAFALFTGSVLRAGFMLLLYLLGAFLRRDSDGLNSLGFAVIVCLLLDPFLAGNVGFVLSVLSTATIFVLAFALSEKLMTFSGTKRVRVRRVLTALSETLSVSLCVCVVTAPVLIYFFGSVSLVGVITNLLFLPLTTPLLLCGGASLLLGGVPLFGTALCTLTRLLVLLALRLARFCASLPFAVLSFEKIHALPALVCTGCLCGLLWLLLTKGRQRARRVLAAVLTLTLLVCAGGFAVYEAGVARLVVLQAGQGSAVFLKKGNAAVLLRYDCDAYYGKLVLDELLERRVHLTAAVLNGSKNDAALCEKLQVQALYPRGDAAAPAQTGFSFADFQIGLQPDGVLLEGRGHTFFLSDRNTLALSGFSGIIHTDNSDAPLSAARDTLIFTVAKNGALRLRGENDWHILMKKN